MADLEIFEGGANEARRAKAGGVLGEGQRAPPHQLGGLGSTVSSPAGSRAEPQKPKGFPAISAVRMAFRNTLNEMFLL